MRLRRCSRRARRLAQVIEASGVIEEAGFTIIDDLLHGYGGGYLPPILGCKSRPAGPVPQEPFRAGQTVVIQPNVVTRDGKAGVQTGEMVLITDTGIERLHAMPRGFRIIGDAAPPSSRRFANASDRRGWSRCGCRPLSSSTRPALSPRAPDARHPWPARCGRAVRSQ